MKLKQLLTDDDAVSPVIGVILMVAITVILAAVIGTFVLGLGDRVSEAQPNAQFTFDYGTNDGGANYATISHDGGDGVTTEQVTVQINGEEAWNGNDYFVDTGKFDAGDTNDWDTDDKLTAGDAIDIVDQNDDDHIADGNSVQIIWTASGSDKTAVIGESEVSL